MSSETQPQPKPHVRHTSKASLSTNTTISSSSVNIHPTSFLHDKAIVTTTPPHTITLEPNAQVHAFAKLDASTCSIIIGEGCIVWERAVLGTSSSTPLETCTSSEPATESPAAPLQVHTNAQIQPHALVQSGATIASNAIVDCHAIIGANACIGAWTRIAPNAVVPPHTKVPDFTVVMGGNFIEGTQIATRRNENPLQWRVNTTLKADERVRVLMERGHGRALEGLVALGMGMGKGVRSMGTNK